MNKIGFCCKWIDSAKEVNGISADSPSKKYNTGATTVAWLNRQSRSKAEERLWDLVKHNIESLRLLVERVGTLEEPLRMVRLSSDVLPMYTQEDWRYFYQLPDVRFYCERAFARVGEAARSHGVRVSFHPGQFTVLASENPAIVDRSIDEFEYHVDMARWMGYGQRFQDIKINVHISGKRGPAGIREALGKMSPEARNTITIENDEMTWGIDSSLELIKDCALVLDIHHHWINTGEYIQANDTRIQMIVDSWRGVRPVIHYSTSREDVLVNHCKITRPDFRLLVESGSRGQKLRAHSDFFWNRACNDWALGHLAWADIMCESKGKNLASRELYDYYVEKSQRAGEC